MSQPELHPRVQQALDAAEVAYEVIGCDPELADTAAFCEHYGFTLQQSANTILVSSKRVDPTRYAACVVLATTKLDVNKKVCELLGVKRASFADGEITQQLTGMMVGGVTAPGITGMPIYVDAVVMQQSKVVMGGGNRSSKIVLNPWGLSKLGAVSVVDGLAQGKEQL